MTWAFYGRSLSASSPELLLSFLCRETLGWYRPGEGAGLVGAVVGAVIVLLVYGMVAGRRRAV
jgi:uncharacterized membrane protein YeaQ/YmgE (transglycosylase-associated protein family)